MPLRPQSRRRRVATAVALLSLSALVIPGAATALPDGRGWELVSPVAKNGGEIRAAGDVVGGGVFQASADGTSVTYSSTASFGTPSLSAPPGSQYLSTRVGSNWTTSNLNVPIFSGSYGADPDGVPYQLFSPDLSGGLLLNGVHCRGEESTCPVPNPALAGTDAPTGYQNYYLRRSDGFEALIGTGDVANTPLDPAAFSVRLAGASPGTGSLVLETCAALTPGAPEAAGVGGCDAGKPNLYEWSAGGGLRLVNAVPGAALGAQSGAISEGGDRVYFSNLNDGNLYLRDGALLKQVDADAAGGGVFQTATPGGELAFFTRAGHLWRYDAAADAADDLTPAGEVAGMVGASAGGDYAYYYVTGKGLFVWHAGDTTQIAESVDPGNFPPATATARISPDGTRLVFVSSAPLTGYDNTDEVTGEPDSEVFFYDVASDSLVCASCRTTGVRPIGPASIPGAYVNGDGPEATATYRPRVLSGAGNRLFFDSADSLVARDVNRENDVYEWVPPGGACANPNGCVDLISSGRSPEGARFIDASATGDDVFFVTDESLVGNDPGAFDLYDARVGGGNPEPPASIACFGDACQELPSQPVDPALNTLVTGPGNPKVKYVKYSRGKKDRAKCKGSKKRGAKKARCKGKGKKKGNNR